MMSRLAILLCLMLVAGAGLAQASGDIVCPRVAAPPVVDGALGDAAWPGQPQIANFYLVSQYQTAPKPISGYLCFDDKALYLGFRVTEPKPELLKTGAADGSRNVYTDDCLEIFLRTSDSAIDFDQFITNAAGARQSERCRNGIQVNDWRPQWPVAAKVYADHWIVEMAIPWSVLEVAPPVRGQMFQLGLGHEDYTKTGPSLTNWPAGVGYGASGGYGRMFFETANQLTNVDFGEQKDGKAVGWTFSEKDADAALFSPVDDAGTRAIVFKKPGRYAIAQQSLRLRPNSMYVLQARVKGAGVNLRARTAARPGTTTTAYSLEVQPSAEYQAVELPFPTGVEGTALIIFGATDGVGEVYVADLRVAQSVAVEAEGPAIALPAGKPLRVQKAIVTDCRALRGFVGAPVDGRLASYNWDMAKWEYNQGGAGAGVGYGYRNNDGLHVTLADKKGVDAVQIREGVRVKMYAGADRYDDPGKAPLLWEFKGKARSSRALLPSRAMTDRFSFFDLTDGLLANAQFLRIEPGMPSGKPGVTYVLSAPGEPQSIEAALQARFDDKNRTLRQLAQGPAQSDEAPAKLAYHLLTPPLAQETSLDAIGLKLSMKGSLAGCPLTVAVQDPVNPLEELMSVEFSLGEGSDGQFNPVLDFPNIVIPAGRQLWLTLTFGAKATIGTAEVQLYELTREQAAPEAVAYRKLLMRGLFSELSEARQWGGLRRNVDPEKLFTENHWGPGIRELAQAIAYCKALAPEDDMVRQYDEWIWRSARDLPEWPTKYESAPGAPEWANVLRQAWLENRSIAQWWLDNRLVPTGELGGLVGDDSDMYQNWACFPLLESDGVGARCKAAARELAELADRENIEYGLNKHSTDPLHAYEEGVNHESLMLWWNYGDPLYFERCLMAAKYLPALTVMTDKGHRHFKSQVCGSEDVRIDRPVDVDGHAHPLMWHPALEVAWYNRSPQVLKYLDEWAAGWAAHDEPGKYAISVDVATDTTKETTPRPLYGGYSAQATTHAFLYFITGKAAYLDPFMYYFKKAELQLPMKNFIPELYQRGYFEGLDTKDKVLDMHPVTAAVALGRKDALIKQLKADITELQRFKWMYTGAEVFTDRIFLDMFISTVQAYTGGYATRNKFNQTQAVSWEGLGTDYAALVVQARPDHFKALVYNFSDKPVTGSFRLWLLDHGRYQLTQGLDADGDEQMDKATRTEAVEVARATRLPLTLAPRAVTVIELTQTEKLDDLLTRADLAVNARDLKLEKGVLKGIVHNIGAAEVKSFTVTLLDGAGKVLGKQTLGPLAAPVDLTPKTLAFEFKAPARFAKATVVVDAGKLVPEIYEGNDAATLP
ncbi:MAG: sugar-binding protein [Armatimonadia bacterium]